MRDLPWDDVRILLALLRSTSVGRAAAQLGVDQSTIRRRIAALERSLGSKLFARSTEGLRPTGAAERLRAHAERIEAEMLALRATVAGGSDRASGTVRIAATEGLAAFLVERGLLSIVDTEPDLRLEIIAGNQAVDVARGEADVAVRLSALKQASLRVRCVARYGIGLYASPAYRAQRGGLVRSASKRATLAGHDVLLPSGELSRMPEAKWLASREGVRVVLRSNSMPALVAGAVAGRGIAAIGLGWGDRTAGLERIAVLGLPARPIFLVTSEREHKRSAVRIVSERIASFFASVDVKS